MIREGIQKLIEGNNLSSVESREIMREVISGKATHAQTACFSDRVANEGRRS